MHHCAQEPDEGTGWPGSADQPRSLSGLKEIVDRVRKDVVVGYLRDESLSLLDLAFLLGFAEQSSFSRAFKRWYGMSPQQYRRHLGLL